MNNLFSRLKVIQLYIPEPLAGWKRLWRLKMFLQAQRARWCFEREQVGCKGIQSVSSAVPVYRTEGDGVSRFEKTGAD